MYWREYLQNPVLVAIAIMLFFGTISVCIAKVRKQPLHAAFILGIILGPLGCSLVFFQKRPLTEQEERNIVEVFKGAHPHQFFEEKRIKEIINEINLNIKMLLFGRYIIPLGIICVIIINFIGIRNLKLYQLMFAFLLIFLAAINGIFSGYAITLISKLTAKERPGAFLAGGWDLFGIFYSLFPKQYIEKGKDLTSKLQV